MLRNLLNNKNNWNKVAIIENDKEILFRELFQKAVAVKTFFKKNLLNAAIMIPNGADFISALFGVIMSGNIAFPLNVLMTKSEIAPLLKQASVSVVITLEEYYQSFKEIKKNYKLNFKILNINQINLNNLNNKLKLATINENSPMLLLSTSGTTEKCKIVQLSEKNIKSSAFGYIDKMNFKKLNLNNIRFILSVPFCSAYGIMILTVCLMHAFPIVILNGTFTLDSFYHTVEKHKVTNYEGSASVIFLMDKMANRPILYDISTLKYFGFGGSKISGSVVERVSESYKNMAFYQGYGMTETSPLIAKHPRKPLVKTHSVGAVIKGMHAAVENNNKIISTPYVKGEIVVKGANVMLGYYKNKKATNQIIKNGYLHTGDIGYLDEEGYLYICGRKKNVIIVRGFNVYPEEVEDCLQNSLLVKDCFVYKEEDILGNEIICADIVPLHRNLKKEDIRAYLNNNIASYKHPQKIIFCNLIKKNAAGKTQRTKEAKA